MFQKKRKALDNLQTAAAAANATSVPTLSAAAASATSVPTLSAAGFLNPLVTTASYLPISDTTKAMMKEFPKKSTEYLLKQYDPGYSAFMGYDKDGWNRNLKQKIEKIPTISSFSKVIGNKDLQKKVTSYLVTSDTCAALCSKMPGSFVFKNTQTGEVKNCVKECATIESMKEYTLRIRSPRNIVVNLKIQAVWTNYDGKKVIVFESNEKTVENLFEEADDFVRDEKTSDSAQSVSDWVNDNCELRFFRSGKPINYNLLPSELFDVNYKWDEDDVWYEEDVGRVYFTAFFTSK